MKSIYHCIKTLCHLFGYRYTSTGFTVGILFVEFVKELTIARNPFAVRFVVLSEGLPPIRFVCLLLCFFRVVIVYFLYILWIIHDESVYTRFDIKLNINIISGYYIT